MKVADLDFYFNLKEDIQNSDTLKKYHIIVAQSVDLHKLLTKEWLHDMPWYYTDWSSIEDVITLQHKVQQENKYKLHIYDTDTGKSKFLTLKDLPLYLKQNKVINLELSADILHIKEFHVNIPKTFYHLRDILVYVNKNKSIFVWNNNTCFRVWKFLNSDYLVRGGKYEDDYYTYGVKVHGGGIKFYYHKPSKYIYCLGWHSYAKEFAKDMTKEQFIEYAKYGKFDFFGD